MDLFKRLLNFIGIKVDKLVAPQEDDLIENDSKGLEYDDKGLYLQEGDAKDEVRLIQMALRKKITHVLDDEDIDLCRSILSSKINGINSQQYDHLISIISDNKVIRIADKYIGLDSYNHTVNKMMYYTNSTPKDENYFAPVFVSYIMQTAYPSWKFKSQRVFSWMVNHLPQNTYARQIKSLNDLKYEKVYIGGWYDSSGSGHIFFVDPVKTAKGSFKNIHTIEGNTYTSGSLKDFSISRRIRKYHKGSKIKIFEVTV